MTPTQIEEYFLESLQQYSTIDHNKTDKSLSPLIQGAIVYKFKDKAIIFPFHLKDNLDIELLLISIKGNAKILNSEYFAIFFVQNYIIYENIQACLIKNEPTTG